MSFISVMSIESSNFVVWLGTVGLSVALLHAEWLPQGTFGAMLVDKLNSCIVVWWSMGIGYM